MKASFFAVAVLVCLAAGARPASQTAVEMTGFKATLKMQTAVEGFFTPINGKLDLRATEVELAPGGAIKDHIHFGPGIRRVLSGELTLRNTAAQKEQVVHAGEYFYEPGDVDIWAVNRASEPAKLLVVELVPAGLKGSAMVPLSRRAELAANGTRLKQEICSAK